jgi:hypothetical protein
MEAKQEHLNTFEVRLDWQECALIARALRAYTPREECATRQLGALVPAFEVLAAFGWCQFNLTPDVARQLVLRVPDEEVLRG